MNRLLGLAQHQKSLADSMGDNDRLDLENLSLSG